MNLAARRPVPTTSETSPALSRVRLSSEAGSSTNGSRNQKMSPRRHEEIREPNANGAHRFILRAFVVNSFFGSGELPLRLRHDSQVRLHRLPTAGELGLCLLISDCGNDDDILAV